MLGMDGAGIAMVTTLGNRGVVCATDDVSARIEELQFSLGEGPCVDALDLYSLRSGELDSDQLPAALMAADAAALALLHLDTSADAAFDDDFDARSTYQLQVHQATGMVQVQLGATAEEAFLMLRARAFAAGRPLGDVATEVVQRRVRFSEEDR